MAGGGGGGAGVVALLTSIFRKASDGDDYVKVVTVEAVAVTVFILYSSITLVLSYSLLKLQT